MPTAKKRTRSRIPKATFAWLLRKYKVCVYCGSDEDLTGDHVIPISQGGVNNRSNTVLACRPCNSRKGRLSDRADRQNMVNVDGEPQTA